jgi:hypothetical protein
MDYCKLFFSVIDNLSKELTKKENRLVISLLGICFLFFCYLATFPKHSDFESITYPGKIFASGVYDLSPYLLENGKSINCGGTPLFGILLGIWIKFGVMIFSFDLDKWTFGTIPVIIKFWCMIPYLILLLILTIISFHQSNNKWLAFICFGTFSFVSIIIMGQVDIWNTLWIYIALLLAIKAIETEKNLKYIFLSIFSLGLSMQWKPFGGLIFPILLFFFWLSFQNKRYSWIKQFFILSLLTLIFLIISFWGKIVWFQNVSSSGVFLTESSWLFSLRIATDYVASYHTISIWLLGYIFILFDMINMSKKSDKTQQWRRLLIFYVFCVIAWFFVSVFTHPQWWLLLIPPFLLVLDNFSYRFNYLFYILISILFLFFTMQFTNNVDRIMIFYMPIIPVEGFLSIIIMTLISAIFLIWMYGLRQEILGKPETISIENNNIIKTIQKIVLIFPTVLIVILVLFISFFPPSIPKISQNIVQIPVGEIIGEITAGQTFYSPYSNLDSIDVFMATWARNNTKDVTFHLKRSPESSNEIASITINAHELKDNSYYKFKFPKIIDSADKSYYFYIDSPNSVAGDAITIWSSKEDVYHQGTAYINSTPFERDLTFKVYYS